MEIQLEPDRSLAKRWGFEADFEMPGGHCSRVYASADRVLKVPFQGEEMSSGRVAALLLSGTIGPRIFESDSETGALLMERMNPGTNLAESGLTENERLVVFSQLAMESAVKPAHSQGLMPLSEFMANSKCPLVPKLLATSPAAVFLHGDLHHFNILLHGDRWLAIDPKGLYGDPAFEAAAYVRNPIPGIADDPYLKQILESRIKNLSKELGVDPRRIWGWTIAEIWDVEPGSPWGNVKDALMQIL